MEDQGIHSTDDPGETVRAPMIRQRRMGIVELVQERGEMRVAELARIYRTSEVTIRNDLARLEREGAIERDRGGAVAVQRSARFERLQGIEQRQLRHDDIKRRIGETAASLVDAGDTIIMDAGTTVVEMAGHLATVEPLTVVTNAINVTQQLAASTRAQVIMLGGNLNRESASLLGPLTERGLGELVVQKLFLGTQAIGIDEGLTDTTLEIAEVKRAMIRAARQVILLADSSKWSAKGFIKVAHLEAIHTIVTDSGLPVDSREGLERLGVRVMVV